jgi:glucosyl-3-phosphoglycerate synthase
MLSIIIPALNEAATIESVVRFARRGRGVDEVLVVDDGSTDDTAELAEAAGARVLTSTLLGKGASMEDGLRAARGDLLLFLDGDLVGLADDLVERMTAPLLSGDADFVKARFSRASGRVTTLTARPLLSTFFPELAGLEQPLGGIVAARRSTLEDVHFETDYGVDIGLLIDVAVRGTRIVEVDIGHLEHDSQPLAILGEMATQVTRTILRRAARHGRLGLSFMQEVLEVERSTQLEVESLIGRVGQPERLALFDMDGTLIRGRFIVELARREGREAELARWLDRPDVPAEVRTTRIAEVFRGVPRQTFIEVARGLPLVEGAAEAIVRLRRAGYRVGLITDSYLVVAETVRRRVFADFSIGNLMRFSGGKATGRVHLAPAYEHPEGCPRHAHCKRNALRHLVDRLELDPVDIVAVGDSENDVCLLESVGVGLAFEPKSPGVARAARATLNGGYTTLDELLATLA